MSRLKSEPASRWELGLESIGVAMVLSAIAEELPPGAAARIRSKLLASLDKTDRLAAEGIADWSEGELRRVIEHLLMYWPKGG